MSDDQRKTERTSDASCPTSHVSEKMPESQGRNSQPEGSTPKAGGELVGWLEELDSRIDNAADNECCCGSIQSEHGCDYCSAFAQIGSEARAFARQLRTTQPNPTDTERLIATRFQIRNQFNAHEIAAVSFDRTNSPFYTGERWAVRRGGVCLTKDSEWEYEPLPSSRNDEFYARCRFDSLEEAVTAYDAAMSREKGKE